MRHTAKAVESVAATASLAIDKADWGKGNLGDTWEFMGQAQKIVSNKEMIICMLFSTVANTFWWFLSV